MASPYIHTQLYATGADCSMGTDSNRNFSATRRLTYAKTMSDNRPRKDETRVIVVTMWSGHFWVKRRVIFSPYTPPSIDRTTEVSEGGVYGVIYCEIALTSSSESCSSFCMRESSCTLCTCTWKCGQTCRWSYSLQNSTAPVGTSDTF